MAWTRIIELYIYMGKVFGIAAEFWILGWLSTESPPKILNSDIIWALCEKTCLSCLRTTKAQTSLRIGTHSLISTFVICLLESIIYTCCKQIVSRWCPSVSIIFHKGTSFQDYSWIQDFWGWLSTENPEFRHNPLLSRIRILLRVISLYHTGYWLYLGM